MRRHLFAVTVTSALLLTACAGEDAPPEGQDTPPSPIEASTSGGETPTASDTPTPTAEPIPALDDVRLAYEQVATGFDSPIYVTPLLGTDEDLLVVEQPGRIRRHAFIGETTEWLDLSDVVGSGGNEQGLLGVALHPDFPEDDRVFVHYTDRDGATTLDEFRAGPNGAERETRRNLLSIDQPASNHNGGMLAFGPDGLLYLALGDGGAAGDRFGNGQDRRTPLGAILRIDVDGARGEQAFAIPDGNPFADNEEGDDRIWVYGLRNPWRFTFDGDRVFIGDVGQGSFEEISTVTLDDGAGANLGWPITEGDACFSPSSGCDRTGLTLPVVTYETGPGGTCSVIQGYAYRGSLHPALDGHVFYSDFCAGFLRSFRLDTAGAAVDQRDWTGQVGSADGATSFGLDHAGELLLTTRDGRILRLAPAA